jgi:peptidoglycan/LPS O-acetylase OafA/YrhL
MLIHKSRIHELDGLRGIAILMVVTLHWIIQPWMPALSKWGGQALYFFAYGVDLFFVISGFLIGGILLGVGNRFSGMRSFYIRRILRIWPLYYLLLGIVYLFAQGKSVFFDIPYWTFFLFIFNFWESAGFILHQALGQLWSIAIEEQFYALGPLMFMFLNRKQLAYLTSAYIIFSPFLQFLLTRYTELDVWRFTPARLSGISVGILLAIILSSPETVAYLFSKIRTLKFMAFALLVLAIASSVTPLGDFSSIRFSLVSVAFGAVLMTVQIQSLSGQSVPVLNLTFLRYLGLRCYSIYLFHIFFMLIARALVKDFFIALLIQTALTLGFAHFSWKYLEAPLIRFGRRYSYESA